MTSNINQYITNTNQYITSKINFPTKITSLAGAMVKKHGLRSVKFLENDNGLTFTVEAHKFEYDSAMRIMKKAKLLSEGLEASKYL